jgi:hypothetical protein
MVGASAQGTLVTMHCDARGVPFLAAGAPRAHGAGARELAAALRTDLGPFEVVPAYPVTRAVGRDEHQPIPEVCLPYRQANRLGYVLRNRLPLLFVRNRQGELLGDARTALAYALSRPRQFVQDLAAIRAAAPSVLVPEAERRHLPADVIDYITQPYHSFTAGFYGIPTGVFAESQPGIGLWLGPLVNRLGPLCIRAGLVEIDWHRREVFLVADCPEPNGDSLFIPAGTDLAQAWFVAYEQSDAIRHEHSPPPEGISYDQVWRSTTERLVAERRGILAHNSGVRTVSLDCAHCRMSMPEAADDPHPAHSWTDLYVPTYKTLRRSLNVRSNS